MVSTVYGRVWYIAVYTRNISKNCIYECYNIYISYSEAPSGSWLGRAPEQVTPRFCQSGSVGFIKTIHIAMALEISTT